jgi:hypothetical protein
MLDLDKLGSGTYTYSLVLPDGSINDDVKITVRGDDHSAVKSALRKITLEAEQRKAQRARQGKKGDEVIDDAEYDRLVDMGVAFAAIRVESIKGMAIGGKEIGADVVLISTALEKHSWLRKQVEERAAEAANFLA